ncbi:hypothetical protein E2F43_07060 [Seongchinamella unica]|uniref:LssY-like C-terminal domain-containing protein n=1 Tax=Seongchinamella unica TaxID=2547392 RepID=A0A4R5LX37_9GAMM|nr:hypothetical protein E2F43_07060 [Seongchinamella unica]
MQSKTLKDVTVSVAILTDDAAQEHFGFDFGAAGLSAVWLSIRNESALKLWFMRNALDPDIFSPDEVTLMLDGHYSAEQQEAIRQFLRNKSVRVLMEPGMITEGFVYLPKVLGGRYIDIRLAPDAFAVEMARRRGDTQSLPHEYLDLRFGFSVPLPDGIFDYERLDPGHTYAGRSLPSLSEAEFRQRLESLPCCAFNQDGSREGDPLNLVIVGESDDVLNSLSRAGWSFTHRITPESIQKLVSAAASGGSYPVAPVSGLYAFERKQDFALQRSRRNIVQRNHLRLWLAPFLYDGQQVWVGQISRDIGIKLTPESPTLTTHIIDPEVDLTREYFLHSLLAEGLVRRFGFVSGSRRANPDAPAVNLTDDPYFSDGLRLVVELSTDPVAYRDVRNFLWEQSSPPLAEGQSEAARRNVRPIGTAPKGQDAP